MLAAGIDVSSISLEKTKVEYPVRLPFIKSENRDVKVSASRPVEWPKVVGKGQPLRYYGGMHGSF
jgi:hypothetical protein